MDGMCVHRLGSPFAVHVSRDVSNSELRATLIDCVIDMFKESAYPQVDTTFKNLKFDFCYIALQFWFLVYTHCVHGWS